VRWALLAAAPFVAFAVFFAFEAAKYTRMISNIFLSLVYRPPYEPPPSSRGEKVTILDSGGREIEALFMESRGSKRVLVFCHESGATKESWDKYAYFMPSLGWSVLAVDLARREAEGKHALAQWPTDDDVRRLSTALQWCKAAAGPDVEIALFGVSNGADIAFAASFGEPRVTAVVTDGLFSMKEIFRDYIRKWAPILVKPNFFGEKFPEWVVNLFTELGFWYSQRQSGRRFVEVESYLKRRGKPLLMIHGEKDDYVPVTHQRFLEKIGGRASGRLVVPGAGHNQAVSAARADYERAITAFLKGPGRG
jgi:pimeloyl-ACP methyl ester carboxylesterase